jgi:hypothetical protein
MNYIRGVAVWIFAPLLASLLCTFAWWIAPSGAWAMGIPIGVSNWRIAAAYSLLTMPFTVAGSAFLSLLFAGMTARPVVHRYFILVGLGALIGGAILLILGLPASFIAAGAIYGVVTACFWVGLHRAVFGSQ